MLLDLQWRAVERAFRGFPFEKGSASPIIARPVLMFASFYRDEKTFLS